MKRMAFALTLSEPSRTKLLKVVNCQGKVRFSSELCLVGVGFYVHAIDPKKMSGSSSTARRHAEFSAPLRSPTSS